MNKRVSTTFLISFIGICFTWGLALTVFYFGYTRHGLALFIIAGVNTWYAFWLELFRQEQVKGVNHR